MQTTNGSPEKFPAGSQQDDHAGEKLTAPPSHGPKSPVHSDDVGQEMRSDGDDVYAADSETIDNNSGQIEMAPAGQNGRLVKKIKRTNRFIDETLVGLDPFTALLWLVLFRMEENGIATATHGRLAQLMGKSKKTVVRHIRVLEANRLLRRVHTGGWGRGYNKYKFGLMRLTKDNPLKAYKPKSQQQQQQQKSTKEPKPEKNTTKKPANSNLLRRKPSSQQASKSG
jgi:hypothetical protein